MLAWPVIPPLTPLPVEPQPVAPPLTSLTRTTGALVLRGWLAAWFRFSIVGRENLPHSGSFVMVSNHASHLDALCLLAALPLSRLDRARPCAASDYFFSSPIASALSATFLNALPFDRNRKVRESLRNCRNTLHQPDSTLILFPEGTRSTTGQINHFRPGIGELVAGSSIPVIPCYIHNAGAAWPKGTRIPRPRKVTLCIGQPMTFSHLPHNRPALDTVARQLEQSVRSLATQFQQQRMVQHEQHALSLSPRSPALASAY